MIQKFADWLVYGIFGLEAKSHLGEAVNFFFYDTVKIILLLFLISVVMGVVKCLSPDRAVTSLSNYPPVIWAGVCICRFVRSDNAILLMLIHSVIHRLRQRRDPPGSYVKLPDYLSAGK